MPRTARNHGVWPHFREPPSFHFRKYPRERSLRERDGEDVIGMVTNVKWRVPQYRTHQNRLANFSKPLGLLKF